MKKGLTLIYLLAAVAYTLYAFAEQVQPALFWICLFVDHVDETYPLLPVGLLTFLTLLMPLIIILVIKRMLPEKPQSVEGPGVWIIRKRQLQSALVEIPVYVNNEKAGGIKMGKIRFFPAAPGRNTVIAGKGLSASEPVEFNCGENEQVYLNLEIAQNGLLVKNVLKPVAPAEQALR